jgi:hypothetical protein
MLQFSTHTLMIAISATVMERCRLLARIASVPPEVDDDEHLSEQVMDIDSVLGELSGPYEAQLETDRMFPDYDTLVANTKKHYESLYGVLAD